jgi:hypothetical protein
MPPRAPVAKTQQRKPQQVLRREDALPSGELGAAHREQPLGAKAHHVETRPIAVSVTDRHVHVFPREIGVMLRCRDAQIELRVALSTPQVPRRTLEDVLSGRRVVIRRYQAG